MTNFNNENSKEKIENIKKSYLINYFIHFTQFNIINLYTDIPSNN